VFLAPLHRLLVVVEAVLEIHLLLALVMVYRVDLVAVERQPMLVRLVQTWQEGLETLEVIHHLKEMLAGR
jgi:hypothetical protein